MRALVETTILPRDALQYLIDRSVHIHALGQVEIENGMRYGGLNRVRWSMNVTGRWSCDAYKKRGEEWPLVMSPIAGLAHELMHAWLTHRHNVSSRIVQEAYAIAVQNLAMDTLRGWHPEWYDDTYGWGDYDCHRPNPYGGWVLGRRGGLDWYPE